MKIQGPISQGVPQGDDSQIRQKLAQSEQLIRDSLEPFDAGESKEQLKEEAELAKKEAALEEAAAAAKSAEEESGFEVSDILPFGIGNWFDDKGTFQTDLGRTILSVICPIPFVGGLLADFGGDWLGNALADVVSWAGGAVSDATDWLGGVFEDVGGAVGGAVEDAAEAVGDVVEDVGDAIGDAAGAVADAIGDIFSW